MKLEEAAAEAGLTLDQAKSLVESGLVTPDPVTGAFDAWRVAQLSVAKRAQELGVAEEEIAGLMAFFTNGAKTCAALQRSAEQQRAAIESQLAELKAAKSRYLELKGAA